MNWDNATEWERDLAKFEQLESIAKSLAKIADALAERHTRREKEKPKCGVCLDKGYVVEFHEFATHNSVDLKKVEVPCSCQPAKPEPYENKHGE